VFAFTRSMLCGSTAFAEIRSHGCRFAGGPSKERATNTFPSDAPFPSRLREVDSDRHTGHFSLPREGPPPHFSPLSFPWTIIVRHSPQSH